MAAVSIHVLLMQPQLDSVKLIIETVIQRIPLLNLLPITTFIKPFWPPLEINVAQLLIFHDPPLIILHPFICREMLRRILRNLPHFRPIRLCINCLLVHSLRFFFPHISILPITRLLSRHQKLLLTYAAFFIYRATLNAAFYRFRRQTSRTPGTLRRRLQMIPRLLSRLQKTYMHILSILL